MMRSNFIFPIFIVAIVLLCLTTTFASAAENSAAPPKKDKIATPMPPPTSPPAEEVVMFALNRFIGLPKIPTSVQNVFSHVLRGFTSYAALGAGPALAAKDAAEPFCGKKGSATDTFTELRPFLSYRLFDGALFSIGALFALVLSFTTLQSCARPLDVADRFSDMSLNTKYMITTLIAALPLPLVDPTPFVAVCVLRETKEMFLSSVILGKLVIGNLVLRALVFFGLTSVGGDVKSNICQLLGDDGSEGTLVPTAAYSRTVCGVWVLTIVLIFAEIRRRRCASDL
eukprot:PhM_4_TR4908/c0_g1_i1/m.40405